MRRVAGYGCANSVVPVSVQEQEIETLKGEMRSLKETLDRIESRIGKLTDK
jgi:cell division protein FtsB